MNKKFIYKKKINKKNKIITIKKKLKIYQYFITKIIIYSFFFFFFFCTIIGFSLPTGAVGILK